MELIASSASKTLKHILQAINQESVQELELPRP